MGSFLETTIDPEDFPKLESIPATEYRTCGLSARDKFDNSSFDWPSNGQCQQNDVKIISQDYYPV